MIITASGIAVVLATISSVPSPVRTVIAFWFLLVCPGMAFILLLDIDSPLVQVTLAIALSMALGTIVSEAMMFVNVWSPRLGLFILANVSLIGVILQGVQPMGARPSKPDPMASRQANSVMSRFRTVTYARSR